MTDRIRPFYMPYRAEVTEKVQPIAEYIKAHPTCQQCRRLQAEIKRLTQLLSEDRGIPRFNWLSSWADTPDEISPRRSQTVVQRANTKDGRKSEKLLDEIARLQTELRHKSTEIQALRNHIVKEDEKPVRPYDTSKPKDEFDKNKIGSMYSSLYENEWAAAYAVYLNKGNKKEASIDNLLNVLKASFNECSTLAESQLNNILSHSSLKNNVRNGKRQSDVSDQTLDQALIFRKSLVLEQIADVQEVLFPKVLKIVRGKGNLTKEETIKNYVQKSLEVTWYMCIEVQILSLDIDVQRFEEFDSIKYKHFTEEQDYFDYIVWPALIVDGTSVVIEKGVAQSTDRNK